MAEAIKNRYEFSILFDVQNGNPNGDPDAGNMPRVDPETGLGLVTDVCLKRKIRNYVQDVKEGAEGFDIYIKSGVTLNASDQVAVGEVEQKEGGKLNDILSDKKKTKQEVEIALRDSMCKHFYDIRTFGAVMTTFTSNGLNCGQVRGPVQIGFARSIDPIVRQEISITRVAITKDEDAQKKNNEMGRKSIVPYALYRADGFVSANLARRVTHFSEEDLSLLWDAIMNMFENDHSAARGEMAVRKLVIFKHDSELGNAPSHKTLDLLSVKKKEGVEVPRSFADYDVNVDEAKCPSGVHILCRD